MPKDRPEQQLLAVKRLRLMPDFDEVGEGEFVLSLWWVGDRGRDDGPWREAPLTTDLQRALDAWYRTYEQHCYFHDDRWEDKQIYDAWNSEGWRLWALVNRELLPQGYLVDRAFEGYPGLAPIRVNGAPRTGGGSDTDASLVTAHHLAETVEAANSVLARYDESPIPPR